jgi:acyl carrier protein
MSPDTAARVRQFIQQNFYIDDPALLGDDVSLVNEGIVDSTGMLEVLSFLEEQFSIKVEDAETVPANLETIGRIAAFVSRKQQVRGLATA